MINKRLAEDIYWVLTDKTRFTIGFEDDENFDRIKKERVKIANRYSELKSTHSFSDSERIAIIEWLMDLEI